MDCSDREEIYPKVPNPVIVDCSDRLDTAGRLKICEPSPVIDDANMFPVFICIVDTITALKAPKSTQPVPFPITKELTLSDDIKP